MNIGSLSDIKLMRNPWSLHTISMNNWATLCALKWVESMPKWTPFENRSTTNKTTVAPWKLGNPVMKSKATSSHRIDRGGIGWRILECYLGIYFVSWQSEHLSDVASMELVSLGSSSSMKSFASWSLMVAEWRRRNMIGDATSRRRWV